MTNHHPPPTTGERDDSHHNPAHDPGDDLVDSISRDTPTADLARAARAAFVGRPASRFAPVVWPFGHRARRRRTVNTERAVDARRRRAAFETALRQRPAPARPAAPWRPVSRRSNILVIATLATAAAAGVTITLWLGGHDPQHAEPAAGPGGPPAASPHATSVPTGPSSARTSSPPARPLPIPTSGVDPVTPQPPQRDAAAAPGPVQVVDPHHGEPTRAELATPEDAMSAWLARWCPFTYTDPFATSENRARPAMTGPGWASFDPRRHDGARESWRRTTAARESGRCGRPDSHVSPEAPRSAATAIVIGTISRVVTAPGQPPYVEQISELRIVRHSADGGWRVDRHTEGG